MVLSEAEKFKDQTVFPGQTVVPGEQSIDSSVSPTAQNPRTGKATQLKQSDQSIGRT